MARFLIAALAASLTTSAAASNRQPIIVIDGIPTARISTAGFDLQSPKDRSQVTRRIRLAAEKVCVHTVFDTGISAQLTTPCYVAAVRSGVSQLNALAGL